MNLAEIKSPASLTVGKDHECLLVDTHFWSGDTVAWSLTLKNTGSNVRFKPSTASSYTSIVSFGTLRYSSSSLSRRLFLTDEVKTWYNTNLPMEEIKQLNLGGY